MCMFAVQFETIAVSFFGKGCRDERRTGMEREIYQRYAWMVKSAYRIKFPVSLIQIFDSHVLKE